MKAYHCHLCLASCTFEAMQYCANRDDKEEACPTFDLLERGVITDRRSTDFDPTFPSDFTYVENRPMKLHPICAICNQSAATLDELEHLRYCTMKDRQSLSAIVIDDTNGIWTVEDAIVGQPDKEMVFAKYHCKEDIAHKDRRLVAMQFRNIEDMYQFFGMNFITVKAVYQGLIAKRAKDN